MAKPSEKAGSGAEGVQIEQVPTVDLVPYARNSRTHSDEQVAQIAKTLNGLTWRFCKENDCYAVTDAGIVYRVYGVKKHLKGHRLILNAFSGCQPLLGVNHKDGNKLNNSIDNLEWATVAQNNAHAIANGLHNPRSVNNKNAKVFRFDYVTIYVMHKHCGFSRADLAQANKVCRQTIDNVISTVEGHLTHAAT